MGVLLTIGGNFPRLRAKLTHMVGHLPSGTSCPCRDGILSWLDGWPVRWRAGAQAWLWMREAFLLSTALCGSVLCGIIVAIFSGQVLVAYAASVLVGCCQGPLEPSIMALTSRRFQHAIDSVSSLLIISTNVTSMLVPTAMGLLIPAVGINWVMALPALCCAFAVLPMQFSNRMQPSGANELP